MRQEYLFCDANLIKVDNWFAIVEEYPSSTNLKQPHQGTVLLNTQLKFQL
jgi:hypothetical protein